MKLYNRTHHDIVNLPVRLPIRSSSLFGFHASIMHDRGEEMHEKPCDKTWGTPALQTAQTRSPEVVGLRPFLGSRECVSLKEGGKQRSSRSRATPMIDETVPRMTKLGCLQFSKRSHPHSLIKYLLEG